MKSNKNEIIEIIKEEYKKRINHYININEIEVKYKKDYDIIYLAKGLKVKDKAGFMYTILGIIQKNSEDYVRITYPGEGIEDLSKPFSSLPINEIEEDNIKNKKQLNSDIVKKNKKADFKRSFDVNIDQESADSMYSNEGPYIDVPIKEFEDNFSL
jgi:hypothetical protein